MKEKREEKTGTKTKNQGHQTSIKGRRTGRLRLESRLMRTVGLSAKKCTKYYYSYRAAAYKCQGAV